MVQGSQTQWVPILQYSSHRSKLTKQTINLKYSLNATISPLKYVKTKNPPPTSDSRTHSPNTLFLLPHKKISDTRDWTTDARALRERERERESERARASEQARKHRSLRSYVREGSAGTSRGSGPGRGVARHVTSGGEPYPLSLGPLASTEWSLNQRGFLFIN
jgi:hypothetical protein